MFVHRSTTIGQLLANTYPNDGFYLAQTTRTIDEDPYPDVSKRPMIINGNITNIEVSPNLAVYNAEIYVGVREIADRFSRYESKYKAKYKFWESNPANRFESGQQEGSGELWFAIGDYWQLAGEGITGNHFIILTLANGSKLKIYLPNDFSWGDNEGALFWVAEDGSLYWANTIHSVNWEEVSPQASMDSYYAIRHADNLPDKNIAKSALDGLRDVTSNQNATSIAVDNGSKDFFNDATTSTADSSKDCPSVDDITNADLINKRIDIGYHYGGTDCMYHPMEKVPTVESITFQIPSSEVPYDINDYYNYDNIPSEPIPLDQNITITTDINPLILNGHHLALASGKYDSDNQADTTVVSYNMNHDVNLWFPYEWGSPFCIAVFTEFLEPEPDYDGTNFFVMPFYYKKFRQDIPKPIYVFKTIFPHQYEPVCGLAPCQINAIASISVPEGDDPDYVGTIYTACTLNYMVWIVGHPEERYARTEVWVFRYNDDSDNWTPIGMGYEEKCPGLFGKYGAVDHYFTDVSLAVKDEKLWVFWIKEDSLDPVNDHKLAGAYIPNAATRNDKYSISDTLINTPLNFADSVQIDADFDSNPLYLKPRVVITDKNVSGHQDIWGLRILLTNYVPTGIDLSENMTQNSEGVREFNDDKFSVPAIAMNRNIFTNPGDSANAFSLYYGDFNSNASKLDSCYVDRLIVDNWNYYGEVYCVDSTSSIPNEPDVTSRGFGSRRETFMKDTKIQTNTEVLPFYPNIYTNQYPRIATNGKNLVDIFISWKGHNDADTIIITHIDP